jgi:hypothetical protein
VAIADSSILARWVDQPVVFDPGSAQARRHRGDGAQLVLRGPAGACRGQARSHSGAALRVAHAGVAVLFSWFYFPGFIFLVLFSWSCARHRFAMIWQRVQQYGLSTRAVMPGSRSPPRGAGLLTGGWPVRPGPRTVGSAHHPVNRRTTGTKLLASRIKIAAVLIPEELRSISVRMSGANNKVVERVGVLTGDWNCRIVRGPE